MASRDRTSIFIERRKASNLRHRGAKSAAAGGGAGGGGMKPFRISQKLSGAAEDDHLWMEVRLIDRLIDWLTVVYAYIYVYICEEMSLHTRLSCMRLME